MVQIGLGAGDAPEVVTCSQHVAGEARDWAKVERMGAHPVIYVRRSHANYFEVGAHPYLIGIDNPDGGRSRCSRASSRSTPGRRGRAGGEAPSASPPSSPTASSAGAALRAPAGKASSGTTRPRGTAAP